MVAVTVDVTATSYDKYDPGFGIYDDGFTNENRYGGYDVNQGYYHRRMGQANNYAIKYNANYGNRDAVGPIHPTARASSKMQQRVVVYGRVPQMPGQYHSMGFY